MRRQTGWVYETHKLTAIHQDLLLENIRIYHECEGRIKKIRPEDHHLASQGLPSDDKQ